jgi:GNAT superfamily N-acetyltransferase
MTKASQPGGSPTLDFQHETFSAAIEEARPLLVEHWREIAPDQDTVPLQPDWQKYHLLERAGLLDVTTARDGSRLVGYACYVVGPHLHYKSLIVAEADIFFLRKGYRHGWAGFRLLQEAERNLAAAGVNRIVNRFKANHDLGPVFRRLGYRPIEHVYAKTVR